MQNCGHSVGKTPTSHEAISQAVVSRILGRNQRPAVPGVLDPDTLQGTFGRGHDLCGGSQAEDSNGRRGELGMSGRQATESSKLGRISAKKGRGGSLHQQPRSPPPSKDQQQTQGQVEAQGEG